jgi:hypothetical protein
MSELPTTDPGQAASLDEQYLQAYKANIDDVDMLEAVQMAAHAERSSKEPNSAKAWELVDMAEEAAIRTKKSADAVLGFAGITTQVDFDSLHRQAAVDNSTRLYRDYDEAHTQRGMNDVSRVHAERAAHKARTGENPNSQSAFAAEDKAEEARAKVAKSQAHLEAIEAVAGLQYSLNKDAIQDEAIRDAKDQGKAISFGQSNR